MTNKDRAKAFLAMAAAGDVQSAYDTHVDQNFIHHNQYFKGDRQALLEAMMAAHRLSPNKGIDIRQVYEDGDTVITHSLVTRVSGEPAQIVVVHIFRFARDKIVELWDVGQAVESDMPNENGLF